MKTINPLYSIILVIGLLLLWGCSSSNNDDPSTSAASWGTAELVEHDDTNTAYSPQIAFDADGGAIVVWEQHDGIRWNIWANRYDGSAWGTAELLENNNAGDAGGTQIAFDADGNAIAVWYQYDGARSDIWTNRYDGSDWGTAELVESNDAGSATAPQIAFDADGNAIAVWYQDDSAHWNIWAKRYDGSAWGTAELIENYDAGNAANPQIAFDADGNAIAVWRQYEGARWNLWANRYDGSAWGTAELIETNDAGNADAPQIAFDTDGNAIAVWSQYNGSRADIWANRYDGSWGTAELIESDDTGSASLPQIAFDTDASAIAVWTQHNGTAYSIMANRYDGSTWGTAELIEHDDTNTAYSPQIAFDGNGNAVAVWYQYITSYSNIFANRYDGSAWGTAELVEENDAGDAYNPQIAFDADGRGMAVWHQSDGSRASIWANLYE